MLPAHPNSHPCACYAPLQSSWGTLTLRVSTCATCCTACWPAGGRPVPRSRGARLCGKLSWSLPTTQRAPRPPLTAYSRSACCSTAPLARCELLPLLGWSSLPSLGVPAPRATCEVGTGLRLTRRLGCLAYREHTVAQSSQTVGCTGICCRPPLAPPISRQCPMVCRVG